MVRKVGKLPMAEDSRARVIRTKTNPGALYGVEACPVNRDALATYRASMVDALAETKNNRSSDLVFALSCDGQDLDPEVDILRRRAVAMRRYLSLYPEQKERIATFLAYYTAQQAAGTDPGESTILRQRRHA